jgi:hypothetical protein
MVSKALRKWVAKTGAQIQSIAPGSPWENRYCESFNGKLRDACLRQEIFSSLKEAQIVIGLWQNTCNRVRPHSSLGYRPPAPVSDPDLAFRLPMAAAMQSPLTQPGPKYRSGQCRPRPIGTSDRQTTGLPHLEKVWCGKVWRCGARMPASPPPPPLGGQMGQRRRGPKTR